MTSEPWLTELAHELLDSNVTALVLTGSHARGVATPYSDLDLVRYVKILPPEDERYRLRYAGDTLVSITTSTIDQERGRLLRPESAIHALPGIRIARILHDEDGLFAALQTEAATFDWTFHMQAKADAYASQQLMGLAEETHKVMNGLRQGHDTMILYAVTGLTLGLLALMAAHRGIFIPSENEYFSTVMDAVGLDTAWTYYLRAALGLEGETARMRGVAALGLYIKTADLLRPILRPEHAGVVDKTWAIIAASDYQQPYHED